MSRKALLLSFLPLLAPAAAVHAAADPKPVVPARFQGEWRADARRCGAADDDSRLIIGADRIRFYESSGAIEAAVTLGESDLAIIVELSGEGERWLDVRHFRLSADRKSLLDVTNGAEDAGSGRVHCPAPR